MDRSAGADAHEVDPGSLRCERHHRIRASAQGLGGAVDVLVGAVLGEQKPRQSQVLVLA
jgi:hypothetical protein